MTAGLMLEIAACRRVGIVGAGDGSAQWLCLHADRENRLLAAGHGNEGLPLAAEKGTRAEIVGIEPGAPTARRPALRMMVEQAVAADGPDEALPALAGSHEARQMRCGREQAGVVGHRRMHVGKATPDLFGRSPARRQADRQPGDATAGVDDGEILAESQAEQPGEPPGRRQCAQAVADAIVSVPPDEIAAHRPAEPAGGAGALVVDAEGSRVFRSRLGHQRLQRRMRVEAGLGEQRLASAAGEHCQLGL